MGEGGASMERRVVVHGVDGEDLERRNVADGSV
jgi:hypothetical protein